MIRTYRRTGFVREQLQVKTSYAEPVVHKDRRGAENVDLPDEVHEELHRFSVTERFQPALPSKAFEAFIDKDKSHRQASLTLIPSFKRFVAETLRPNFVSDVTTLVNTFYFRSNLGKVTLSEDGQKLSFDPVEVPATQANVELLVYVFALTDRNQVSLANPHRLAHVFSFQLRLVTASALEKLR